MTWVMPGAAAVILSAAKDLAWKSAGDSSLRSE
jgi:hypothetical protein